VDRPKDLPEAGTLLSICIPARNEEENIAACVQAALASSWPNIEVLVVDDRSTDETSTQAKEAAQDDSRFRLIEGEEPAIGWAGKPWTCARAAKESKGSWLLFVDADVRLDKDAGAAAVLLAEERALDLLSFFGRWTLVGFWERCLIPAVGWFIRGSVHFDDVNHPAKAEGFANGQFILMRRSSYMEMEGHAAVRNQVLEDVRLAQVVKRAGYRAEIRPAGWSFEVRLYRSLSEIVNGYTKNLYEGMNRNLIVGIAAALFIVFGSIFPFFGLIGGLISVVWGWTLLSPLLVLWFLLVCALQIWFRQKIEWLDGRSGWYALTHPLANVLLVLILLRSTFGVRVDWKGRAFVDGKAEKKL
jgi:glycosyltransferase involved in cell wall biosynthesis